MKWFLLLVQPAKFELPLTPKNAAGAHRKKLVARRSLREHVYKRVGAASVTFCGRGKRSVRKSPAKSGTFKCSAVCCDVCRSYKIDAAKNRAPRESSAAGRVVKRSGSGAYAKASLKARLLKCSVVCYDVAWGFLTELCKET